MAVKTTRFDSAEYLDSDEAISAYLEEALETDDPAFITQALGTVARAACRKSPRRRGCPAKASTKPSVQKAIRNSARLSASCRRSG